MENLTDQQFLEGCISGDSQIQEAFIRQFSNHVYRTVQYTLRNKNIPYQQADAEDLHNTIFVKLFEHQCKKLKQFKGENDCSLFSWIRLITIRTVLDHIRKTSKDAITSKGKMLPLEEVMNLKQESPEPITVMEKAEQFQLIEKGMQSLIPRYRLFLKLHFYNRPNVLPD